MVNFAELKAKAEKAKDATVTKVTNTRDRYTSAPSSRVNWDPNWKRAPPTPPPRGSATSEITDTGTAPLAVPRASRPMEDLPPPPPYLPPPPPRRTTSGYPPSHRDTSQEVANEIDWANLSPEDKEAFFGWLDEFFSRYLGIELSPRERGSVPAPASVSTTFVVHRTPNRGAPPPVNVTTRPQGLYS